MTRKTPNVRQYMTRLPIEAERCETVSDAAKIMQSNDIHHIPVMRGSHLHGIVSQSDVNEARLRFAQDVGDVPLEEICQRDVLTVGPLCPISEVAEQMLKRGVGSAVVVDCGFVVGIFTTTDALRVLTTVLG